MSHPALNLGKSTFASALTAALTAWTVVTALVLPARQANAAVVTLAGTINGLGGDDNDEVDRWRSTSAPKTLDPDVNNVYGTAGYVMFAGDDLGNGNVGVVQTNVNPFTFVNGTRRTVSSVPSYLTFNVVNAVDTGIASSYGYKLMDDPTISTGPTVANRESGALLVNAAIGTEVPLFDMVIGSNAPAGGLRLGLFYGNTDAYNGTFRIQQIVGGSGTASATQSSAIAIQIAFFDFTGAAAGDTFRFFAAKNVGEPGNANVLLGGITVDTLVPEPATAATMVVGLGVLLGSRRARRQTRS